MGEKCLSRVVYPPVVIAHINKNMGDYFKWAIEDKSMVHIHYSFQPNGHPHLGTMTSLMTAFTLGEFLQETFKIPVKIFFEQLENAPGYKVNKEGVNYQLMLCDALLENSTKLDVYMSSFKGLINWLYNKTSVEYEIMSYKDFQEIPFVRASLLEIMNRSEEFLPLLNPSEDKLRMRFPCKKCRFMDEDAKTLKIKRLDNDYAKLSMKCFNHGEYEIEITSENNEFIDFNTPIRNAIKERFFVKEANKVNALNLMIDGGDWVGMGELMNHVLGLWGYSAKDLPMRVFTPLIEDWSGAKFSKSVYVKGGTYDYLPIYLKTYPELIEQYGESGLELFLKETREWSRNPKKLFRNYTLEYFDVLFKERLS